MIPVPGNSSRLFESQLEATIQPIGFLDFGLSPENSIIRNEAFNPELIRYDDNYSTLNESQLNLSFEVFLPTLNKFPDSLFIDIGCGQGEFVRKIREHGGLALGFDPVLQNTDAGLYKEFFKPDSFPGAEAHAGHKVFIMRCVLPHIQNPWTFLDEILDRNPDSIVVLQHQNFTKLISNDQWNLLMHDHVNIFRFIDFQHKYNVVEHIEFADSEWDQVILSKSLKSVSNVDEIDVSLAHKKDLGDLTNLFRIRNAHIELLLEYSDVWIYGAAGKGINFAFALSRSGIKVTGALDENTELSGRFLECSGVEIFSFPEFFQRVTSDTIVIVMNQNHLERAKDRIGSLARTIGIKDLANLAR